MTPAIINGRKTSVYVQFRVEFIAGVNALCMIVDFIAFWQSIVGTMPLTYSRFTLSDCPPSLTYARASARNLARCGHTFCHSSLPIARWAAT